MLCDTRGGAWSADRSQLILGVSPELAGAEGTEEARGQRPCQLILGASPCFGPAPLHLRASRPLAKFLSHPREHRPTFAVVVIGTLDHPMSIWEVTAGFLLAAAALYALGLPTGLAASSPGPFALGLCGSRLRHFMRSSLPQWGLPHSGLAGVPLSRFSWPWWWLVWVAAWLRTGRGWKLRGAVRRRVRPALMVAAIGRCSGGRLSTGFGLYLPNQDFKNHAYFVAQVAWTRSADTNLIVRASPISPPETTDFYPLGLHTLLGWALPSSDFSSVAVTAAAAVLVTSISMPLAVIALARAWRRGSDTLWWVAGFVAVLFAALSNGFRIGSVVSLAAAGLYAGALAVLWEWVRRPRIPAAVAVAVCGVGLLVLHVAEAMGLALVAVACLPIAWRARSGQPMGRRGVAALLILGVAGSLTAALMLRRMLGLLDTDLVWDLQPNLEDPVTAAVVAVGQEPGGSGWGRAIWVVLGVLGFAIAARSALESVAPDRIPGAGRDRDHLRNARCPGLAEPPDGAVVRLGRANRHHVDGADGPSGLARRDLVARGAPNPRAAMVCRRAYGGLFGGACRAGGPRAQD